jgi:hypothetical protein
VHTIISFVIHANKARGSALHKKGDEYGSHGRLFQHFLQDLHLLKNGALTGASSGVFQLYSALVV